ncbi:MAG: VWA domain-containing protein, partial [Bacteroidota bacterium]
MHAPNVFQMSVANILPGDTVEVSLRYHELLRPEQGEYELMLPAVVGPHFTGDAAHIEESTGAPARNTNGEPWSQQAYLQSDQAPFDWNVHVRLNAGMPITALHSPSHTLQHTAPSPNSAEITLSPSAKARGTRDFVLRYSLRGKTVQSGLLTFEGESENYFLLMIQPPAWPEAIPLPPREYVFVMDVSGSMSGAPLETSKALVKSLLDDLQAEDRFNIVLFAGGSQVFAEESVRATGSAIAKAERFLKEAEGGGGTQLHTALEEVLAEPGQPGWARNVVLCTDGYVSVTVPTFELVRERLGTANLFGFGIGSSVDRYVLEGLARAGMGEAFVVTEESEMGVQAHKFQEYVGTPVMTDVKVDFGGMEVYDVSHEILPDVMGGRPVVVMGKYRGGVPEEVELAGRIGGEIAVSKVVSTAVGENDRSSAHFQTQNANTEMLPVLWARDRVRRLGDYQRVDPDDERAAEITKLGLEYALLTAYTSFVAVDEVVRTEGGKTETIRQVLPLPAGVEATAVGGIHAFVPDAFTPNGDWVNDIWEPKVPAGLAWELEVYDRWGNLIFSGKSTECKGWNGQNAEGVTMP